MKFLGAAIAVITGIAYNAGAALQKHEDVHVATGSKHLLRQLVKRKLWVAATLLSFAAWVGQVVALALAPVALVVPLLTVGSAVLVVLGVRFLGEKFGRAELAGVALVALGAAAAGAAEAGATASHRALPALTQLIIAGGAVLGALSISRKKSGLAYGAASGLGFGAIAIFSKELGDRFAEQGIAAVPHLLKSPTPYLLAVIAIGAISLLQAGFQRANAASVMAALAVPEAIGPLFAGFWLYHERYPSGAGGIVFPIGIAAVVAGSILLGRHEQAPASKAARAKE